jgi:hypothetical protein
MIVRILGIKNGDLGGSWQQRVSRWIDYVEKVEC